MPVRVAQEPPFERGDDDRRLVFSGKRFEPLRVSREDLPRGWRVRKMPSLPFSEPSDDFLDAAVRASDDDADGSPGRIDPRPRGQGSGQLRDGVVPRRHGVIG